MLGELFKTADDTAAAKLSGRLILSDSGWLLLTVPNALVRGAFSALAVPGIELPPRKSGSALRAHISVMNAEEVAAIPGKINELGKSYSYQLGQIREVKPIGWQGMERVWFIRVDSPQLKELRRSYGLSPIPMGGRTEKPFHITIAVRRKNVLRTGSMSKLSLFNSFSIGTNIG